MTTQRPYQTAMRLDRAYEQLRVMAGIRLDPVVVQAFFAAIQRGRPGTLGEVEVA